MIHLLGMLARRGPTPILVLDDGAEVAEAAVRDFAGYLTAHAIGEHLQTTPEGFLICFEVPIARTGEQIYGPDEILDDDDKPIFEAGPEGYIIVRREASEVFKPEFLQSFEGKPVVIYHPQEDVDPTNWRSLAVGHVSNPRQGTGDLADFVVSELFITEPVAIEAVLTRRLREVSAGYRALYEELEVGIARQYNMRANHVALVEQGRCGARCAIRDHKKPLEGDQSMHARTRDEAAPLRVRLSATLDRLTVAVRDAFKNTDEKERDKLIAAAVAKARDEAGEVMEGEGGDTHIHVGNGRDEEAHTKLADLEGKLAAHDARFTAHDEALEALKKHTGYGESTGDGEMPEEFKEEAPPGTTDAALRSAKDSAFLAEAHQETVAGCEILVPGMGVSAYDKAAEPKKTLDAIKRMRSNALDLAYSTPLGRTIIGDLIGGRKLSIDEMDGKKVRDLFRQAVSTKKAANGRAADDAAARAAAEARNRDAGAGKGAIRTIADLNKANRDRYGARKA